MNAVVGRWLLSSEASIMRRTLLCTCTKAQRARNFGTEPGTSQEARNTGTEPGANVQQAAPEKSEKSGGDQIFNKRLIAELKEKISSKKTTRIPPSARFIYTEFLPDCNYAIRNPIAEKLERRDLLSRRSKVVIPEFYPGTIMAVTTSNVHSPEKTTRFLGICIYKGGVGLRCRFILRNHIEGEGFDVVYELYSPLIQKFEVIRLEKRIDEKLLYLRDALPEYSTFPQDMIPERRPEGGEVPINPLMVVMKPRPWTERWERFGIKGVKEWGLRPWFFERAKEISKPWEAYDLMKYYRSTIPAEEQQEIFEEVYDILSSQEEVQAKERRKALMEQKLKRQIKLG